MIFKTFDSKIDKWTSKIGIFGKSFNELGTAVNNAFKSVINNLDNFDEDVGFWKSLKDNLFSKKDNDKDWIKNSLGAIISQENIDSYIAELDLDSVKEKLKEIFDWQEDVKNNEQTWQDYFNTLDDGEDYIIDLIKNTDDLSKLTGEDLVKANQQARASALAHNEAIKAQTFSAKAGSVALKALSIAGNMLAMWAVSEVISGLYKLSQVSEDVAKSAKELGESFISTKSDIDDYKSKISDLYDTINDSNSSIEDVTNARQTLMSVQDELINKFGTEKETIELITSAINNQSDALDTLTEKQWQVAKNDFNNGGFWNDVGNWASSYEDNIDRMVSEMENVTKNIYLESLGSKNGVYAKNDELIHALEKAGYDYVSEFENFQLSGTLEDVYSDILNIQQIAEEYNAPKEFLNALTKEANNAKQSLDDYGEMWDSYILRDRIFANENLADSWHEVTEAYSEYEKAFTSGNQDAIEKSIGDFSELMKSILNDSDIDESVKDYFENMYPALKTEVDKWEFHAKILPEYDIHSLNGKNKADVLGMLQEDGMQNGEETFNSILNLASKYGIVTGNNTEKINKLLDLLVEWGILQDSINDSVAEYPDETEILTPTISSSIQQLATQLEPQFAKLGEAYKAIFTSDGFTLDDVDNDMLENLRKSFAEIEEEVGVAFDSSVLDPFFDALTTNYDDAEEGAKQVQNAFNELATAYFYSTDTLEQLNAETADAIEKQLEEMGVINASEIVYDALNAKLEALSLQKQFATEYGYDLINATTDEISIFLKHAEATNIARAYLFQLTTAEQVFNNQDLDPKGKIDALKELANAYGQTAITARIANMEIAAEKGHISIDYEKELASLQNEINSAINNVQIDFGDIGGGTSKAGSAGSSAGDAYVDAFEQELSELDSLRDRGVIDEAEYLRRLRELYTRYFADRKEYLDEFRKYERQYLEGKHTCPLLQ